MDAQARKEQLERFRVKKGDERFALERFRIERQRELSSSKSIVWRQAVCTVAAVGLFLYSVSPALAAPFRLDWPKERLVPQDLTPSLPPLNPFEQPVRGEQPNDPVNDRVNYGANGEKQPAQSESREPEHYSSQESPSSSSTDDVDQAPNTTPSAPPASSSTEKQTPATQSPNRSTQTDGNDRQKMGSLTPPLQKTEDGAKLPQTATPAASRLLQGLSLLLLGCALWRKKERKSFYKEVRIG